MSGAGGWETEEEGAGGGGRWGSMGATRSLSGPPTAWVSRDPGASRDVGFLR